jgi:hypothetical protein
MLHFITWKHFNISLTISVLFSVLWFPRKLVLTNLKAFHAAFSLSLKVLWKSRFCITSYIYVPLMIPSFTIASPRMGNLFFKYVTACSILSRPLTKIFFNTTVQWGGEIHLEDSLMVHKKCLFYLEWKCVADASVYMHSNVSCCDCPISHNKQQYLV